MDSTPETLTPREIRGEVHTLTNEETAAVTTPPGPEPGLLMPEDVTLRPLSPCVPSASFSLGSHDTCHAGKGKSRFVSKRDTICANPSLSPNGDYFCRAVSVSE